MKTQEQPLIRPSIVLVASFALLFLFWSPTFRTHFLSLDEFAVFIGFSKAQGIGDILSFMLEPHSQHFAPAFKAFFYVQYKLFGINPAPYHMVSISLFIFSGGLLWKLIKKGTGDSSASTLCALAYSTTTAYYTVIAWVFAQQIIMTFIFIELALLNIQDNNREFSALKAAVYCLLASLCMKYGVAAWLTCALFYFIKQRYDTNNSVSHSRRHLKTLAPLLASAMITVILYRLYSKDVSTEYGASPLDPLLYLHGIIVFIGNSLLESLGGMYLAKNALELSGMKLSFLLVLLKVLIYICFIVAAIAAVALFKRLSNNGKALVLSAFSMAAISILSLIATRATYYGQDIFELSGIRRYRYFPLVFLILGAAPYVSAFSRRYRSALFLLLPVWLLIHSLALQSGLTFFEPSVRLVDKTVTLARLSLDYPLEVDEKWQASLAKKPHTDSRPVKDFIMLPERNLAYLDMLRLFLGPDDMLAKVGEEDLLLRNSHRLGPSDIRSISPGGSLRWAGDSLKASGNTEILLGINPLPDSKTANRQYVLSFMAKAGQPSIGLVTCRGDSTDKPEEFSLMDSFFFKTYQINIPCRTYDDAVITITGGDYALEDMRLYW
jgi:hypothetical protein